MITRRKALRGIGQATMACGAAPALWTALTGCSGHDAAHSQPEDRTAWFREAKFGMFIHWGPYSVAGVEASWPIMKPEWFPHVKPISEQDYVALPAKFNPVEFDPGAWVQLAREAGMRYMVITTKHHDGFCMFDAPGTDYKITNTPYGKDIIALLASACREQKMPLGFYYSPPDMRHPGFRDTSRPATANWNGEPSRPEWATYLDYMETHLRKLLTGYGDVAVLWFDGLFGQAKYDPERFHQLIHALSPRTLINDRLGPNGDYVTPEQAVPDGVPVKRTEPRQEIPPEILDQLLTQSQALPAEKLAGMMKEYVKRQFPTKPQPTPEEFQLWETCMTINSTWGYNPSDTSYKPAETLIRTLVEVASRGGNFLLNVGPSPLGVIPPESAERLRSIGAWMTRNGQSIYGTGFGPIQGQPQVRTTIKDGVTYLHVFDWPSDRLVVEGFSQKAGSITLLAGSQRVAYEQKGSRLTIARPAGAPDSRVSVLAVRT